jgi:hypothetical protein
MALTIQGTVFAEAGTYTYLGVSAPVNDYIIIDAPFVQFDSVSPRMHVVLYTQISPIAARILVVDAWDFYNPCQLFKRRDTLPAEYAWGVYVHTSYRLGTIKLDIYR